MRTTVLSLLLLGSGASGQLTTGPAFDVASIKQAKFQSEGVFRGFSSAGTCTAARVKISGNRATFQAVTLCGLIMTAYEIPPGQGYRITEAPKWTMKAEESVYYDIEARAEDSRPLSQEAVRRMLQTLLADRFRLQLHPDTKPMQVYALVVDSGGAKLSSEPICDKPRIVWPDGTLGMEFCKPTESMDQLARVVASRMDRPVLNRTELSGQYAFVVTWGLDRSGGPPCSPTEEGCFHQPDLPDREFTSAVQRQLGLKLEPRTEPVGVLVIDRAERPSLN